GDTESIHGDGESGFAGGVRESPVVVVVVELERGRASVGMPGEVFAVDEDNVGVSVVVVVDEGATRAHGFGQPLLAECAVVVGEVNSGLGSDIAELDLSVGGGGKAKNDPPQRHRSRENSLR